MEEEKVVAEGEGKKREKEMRKKSILGRREGSRKSKM